MNKYIKVFVVGVVVVWAHEFLTERLVVVKNFGVSFGVGVYGLYAVNILIWGLLAAWWWKKREWGLGMLVIGGGVNLMDRLRLGYVRDYWNLGGGLYNNINDVVIAIGVVLFLYQNIWKK
jgi:lipoprotein signal peptidase